VKWGFFFACAALWLFAYGVGLSLLWLLWVLLALFVVCFDCVSVALAFPCCVIGLLVLPLCGAALTFFAAAKKDKQRKRLNPPAHKWVPRTATVVVHLESVPSHIQPW
jgi:membrane protein implicated in regulation of membrane protease activity